MSEQKQRIAKIAKILKNDDEAIILRDNNNVYYYTGFNHSEGTVIITSDKSYLLVDFRYIETAKNKVSSCEVVQTNSLLKDISDILLSSRITKAYIEASHTTVTFYNKLKAELLKADISLDSSGTLDLTVENQRMIKSETEIGYIQKAQNITEEAYLQVLNLLKPGVREIDIKNELEYLIKKQGGEGASFDLITIAGKNTSLPHGVPGNNTVKNGDFVTFDIGALYKGYHSDMTRTVSVGNPCQEQKKIYSIVLDAQLNALDSIKSGINSSFADKTARDIIENNGYGKCFGHSTGHGVGLDIHEKPNLSPSGNIILSSGMVVTVEPGIYIENKFGVRIEDMVLVTDDGYRNFAKLTKELVVL